MSVSFASAILLSEGFVSEGLPGRMDLINASMSTPFDRSRMDRSVTGRRGGLPPDAWVSQSQHHRGRIGFDSADGRTVFPPSGPIYRAVAPSRQGRSDHTARDVKPIL